MLQYAIVIKRQQNGKAPPFRFWSSVVIFKNGFFPKLLFHYIIYQLLKGDMFSYTILQFLVKLFLYTCIIFSTRQLINYKQLSLNQLSNNLINQKTKIRARDDNAVASKTVNPKIQIPNKNGDYFLYLFHQQQQNQFKISLFKEQKYYQNDLLQNQPSKKNLFPQTIKLYQIKQDRIIKPHPHLKVFYKGTFFFLSIALQQSRLNKRMYTCKQVARSRSKKMFSHNYILLKKLLLQHTRTKNDTLQLLVGKQIDNQIDRKTDRNIDRQTHTSSINLLSTNYQNTTSVTYKQNCRITYKIAQQKIEQQNRRKVFRAFFSLRLNIPLLLSD
eukprot:TRINITY_DN37202_c0_g1_i1.p2 TRINITY_DN37202_c0_g1~~TRINITY_DN37202_c0_g1_i1.p2  ORF type:complete len:329 (-),score=-20.50 TRINITY_DN37202_c0_g1_i1:401-1387(-)